MGRGVFVTCPASLGKQAYWGPYAVSKAGLEALQHVVETTLGVLGEILLGLDGVGELFVGRVHERNELLLELRHLQRHLLLDAVLANAGAASATGVWLGVWEHADWAKKFYFKAGFIEVGTHEFKSERCRIRTC